MSEEGIPAIQADALVGSEGVRRLTDGPGESAYCFGEMAFRLLSWPRRNTKSGRVIECRKNAFS